MVTSKYMVYVYIEFCSQDKFTDSNLTADFYVNAKPHPELCSYLNGSGIFMSYRLRKGQTLPLGERERQFHALVFHHSRFITVIFRINIKNNEKVSLGCRCRTKIFQGKIQNFLKSDLQTGCSESDYNNTDVACWK